MFQHPAVFLVVTVKFGHECPKSAGVIGVD